MPRRERSRTTLLPRWAAAFLPLVLIPAALGGETPQQQLDAVQKAMAESSQHETAATGEAAALAAEIEALRERAVAGAQAVAAHEAALGHLEEELLALHQEENRRAAALAEARQRQGRLLTALVRLARNPPEALALEPGEPVDALRGGVLLGAAVPELEARAKAIGAELAALADLKGRIAASVDQRRAEGEALAAENKDLDAVIARKAALQQEALAAVEAAQQTSRRLARQATDLRDLIDRLESERKRELSQRLAVIAPPPRASPAAAAATNPALADPLRGEKMRPFARAHGRLIVPASGELVRRFGVADDVGQASKGVTFAVRPGARVLAPYAGQILFVGPFRGYGQILIIAHGDGYHSLLAGLDRVDGSVGQWLVTGEPVGLMADDGERPLLYFELRHNNQPINPMPWLAPHDEKVSG